MKKIMSVWIAVAMLGVWVACGDGNKNKPRIQNTPNKIDNKMTNACPTLLGKFEQGSKVIELKFVAPGKIEVLMDGELQAVTGTSVKLADNTTATAVCSNGMISVANSQRRTNETFTVTTNELLHAQKERAVTVKFRRVGAPVMVPAGSTAFEKGKPVIGSGSPAVSTGSPAVAVGSPAVATGSPAVAMGSPAISVGTPAVDTE